LKAGAPHEAAKPAEEILRQSNDAEMHDVAVRAYVVLEDRRQSVERLLLPAKISRFGSVGGIFSRLAEEASVEHLVSLLYEKAGHPRVFENRGNWTLEPSTLM
jgi:hypothetical protein